MTVERTERRLAAILAADVAGYSRLMGEDEEGTLSELNSHLTELVEPSITEHKGRIVKTTGDGLLVEFASVVDAVHCAVLVQEGMKERNTYAPENRKIEFRIGINVGDVIVQDDDVYGDGVNVAARLEGLAQPNGICISRTARDQVRDKLSYGLEDWGEVEVKNIARPVRVFRILPESEDAGKSVGKSTHIIGIRRSAIAALVLGLIVVAGGITWWLPWATHIAPVSVEPAQVPLSNKPSIAVLPFANLSKDAEEEYFSDGITQDLITDLSKVSGLLVIANNSTFAYKGTSSDVRKVGRELGARYVVEGSVRKAAGRVRINAQLVDAKTGSHLWAERYDRDFKDVFALQDEVIEKIVAQLAVALTPDEERRLMRPLSSNPQAYDLYLQGLQQESYFTKQGNENSQRLFLRAIELDSGFASAYARLGQAYSLAIENHWANSPEEVMEKALDAALKGVQLDDELPYAYWSLGRIYSRPFISELDKSKDALLKATALNPNYADGYGQLAYTLIFTGNAAEAFGAIEKAMRINPRFPFWYLQVLGMAQFFTGSYEAAAKSLQQAAERNPNVPWTHRYLLASYGELGKMAEAEWEITEIEALGQPISIQAFLKSTPIRDPDYRKMYENALRKAGLPE